MGFVNESLAVASVNAKPLSSVVFLSGKNHIKEQIAARWLRLCGVEAKRLWQTCTDNRFSRTLKCQSSVNWQK